MGQWRINEQGKRVHKRKLRYRANQVYFYKLVSYNGINYHVFTSKPRTGLAYPSHYKYALQMIFSCVTKMIFSCVTPWCIKTTDNKEITRSEK